MAGRRAHPEDDIMRAIAQHIRVRGAPGLVAFHVPNGAKLGGARNKKGIVIQAARLKGLGVRPGISDWIFLRRGVFHALEIKAPGKVPTAEQRQFLHEVNDAGGYATWCTGLDPALKILEQWELLVGKSS